MNQAGTLLQSTTPFIGEEVMRKRPSRRNGVKSSLLGIPTIGFKMSSNTKNRTKNSRQCFSTPSNFTGFSETPLNVLCCGSYSRVSEASLLLLWVPGCKWTTARQDKHKLNKTNTELNTAIIQTEGFLYYKRGLVLSQQTTLANSFRT